MYWTWDGGSHWVELESGLPTVPVNDLLVHPRENDLVLATHGRGVWILDQVTALQALTPQIAAQAAYLFPVDRAEETRYRAERAHTGNMIFEGENPPAAALIDYWLRDAGTEVGIEVLDAAGEHVATVQPSKDRGVNRVEWNLRYSIEGAPQPSGGRGFGGPMQGPRVEPGLYTVRLTAGGVTQVRTVRVVEDPRIQVDPAVRGQWTATLREITSTLMDAQSLARDVQDAARRLEEQKARASDTDGRKVRDLARETEELASRLSRLRGAVDDWVGPLTADQASQKEFLTGMLATLQRDWSAVKGRVR